MAGISGLGGGIVNVPMFLYVLNLTPHLTVSLSMALIFPSAISSVIRHALDGMLIIHVSVPLSLGAVIGGWIGPKVALGFKGEKLKLVIGVVLLAAVIRMITESILHYLMH